ncbi:hypothetical protein IFT47_16640 [Pseudomonas sp. CFBP 13711]|uniref:hypothetical protein n=1 Tax=unclassified Pseudomonas TaxID=196821 RepID=UPI00178097B6|nr:MULTISPECIES: hypothetical protein [unclassified Pseudomonas]MBD8708259.1 hypothetical protein [Pseudomonas sp. CFBP 13711]MBD8713501.1 hypothetical protein [Pseudomonas sp. CFBP 13715]
MKIKYWILAMMLFGNFFCATAAYSWQLKEVQDCPISQRNKNWLDCTVADVPSRLPYKMDDGSTKLLDSRATVICRQGMCDFETQSASGLWNSTGEYAGQIQQMDSTPVVIHRGYYLGNAADGRVVAYLKGTGPENGGPIAPAKTSTSSNSIDSKVDQCVDDWVKAYRKDAGEDPLISNDQLDEWESRCREARRPIE